MLRRAGVASALLRRPSASCALARRPFHGSVAARSEHGAPATHKDTDYNNANTPFDFTPENYARIDEILAKYPKANALSAVIPLLDLAQRQNNNWLPVAAMNKVAKILKTAPMNVYEVATFYTMFNRQPVGKHFLQLCTTTPCMYGGCGSRIIQETIEKHLGIHAGETTADGLFTLVEVECLGACVNAPMLQLNDDYYEDLEPATTIKLLDDLRAGRPVTPGPQSGKRRNSEGPLGRTTLRDPPTGPYAPYLDKPVEKPAEAKKN